MSQWRLEGAAFDPALVGPDIDVETEESGRVVVIGDLEPLLEIMRIPGFQLYVLQRDPLPERPVAHPV